jgi:hypothetical protein
VFAIRLASLDLPSIPVSMATSLAASFCPTAAALAALQQPLAVPPPSSTDTEVVIVTACSAGFFDRLQNLVGSVQLYEPHARIAVYDIGLTASQRAEATVRRWLPVVECGANGRGSRGVAVS